MCKGCSRLWILDAGRWRGRHLVAFTPLCVATKRVCQSCGQVLRCARVVAISMDRCASRCLFVCDRRIATLERVGLGAGAGSLGSIFGRVRGNGRGTPAAVEEGRNRNDETRKRRNLGATIAHPASSRDRHRTIFRITNAAFARFERPR